mmetsp:Transcript_15901/g.40589  ORF Transcript_15901/g.40589 Transcript_15901/m.40589 type:complete len:205 (+) Transcript_15901:452-1066(+)
MHLTTIPQQSQPSRFPPLVNGTAAAIAALAALAATSLSASAWRLRVSASMMAAIADLGGALPDPPPPAAPPTSSSSIVANPAAFGRGGSPDWPAPPSPDAGRLPAPPELAPACSCSTSGAASVGRTSSCAAGSTAPSTPSPPSSRARLATRISSRVRRPSASSSLDLRLDVASAAASLAGSRSTYWMNQPLSVWSTSHLPARPR